MSDHRHLAYIVESIALVEQYVSGGRESFFSSRLIQDATLYRMQTIAESTQRLSIELKARYPDVEWRRISAFRNVFV